MTNIPYNPDVLDALANLSNDEVFTPPKLVNHMLDLLPTSLWSDPTATFLDPATKSGVFLREIVKRLNVGLEQEIPDLQERLNHILTKQVFGIAITSLTWLLARRSLYCSKFADGKYSLCTVFDDPDGQIRFQNWQHNRQGGKCGQCWASESEYSRADDLENHAYEFIHRDAKDIPSLFTNGSDMKFDVIIWNPPYQLSTGWSGKQAKPLYHHFVEQAKKLNPRYLSMIIPARWYSGWMGLDEFRKTMLEDRRIHTLVDFENSSDVFPGVDVAWWICYFVWDRDYSGLCNVVNISKDFNTSSLRQLDEFNIFIRQEKSISVINKIKNIWISNWFLSDIVSPIKPFGMPTNYEPRKSWTPCRFIQKYGLQFAKPEDVIDKYKLLDKWKILIPEAPIAGQTDFSKPIKIYHNKNAFLAKPWQCCTESYMVAWSFNTEDEALNFRSYLFTKIVRFLILQTVISQHINRKNFSFVPHLWVYDHVYNDVELMEMRWISQEEREYIDSKILETE